MILLHPLHLGDANYHFGVVNMRITPISWWYVDGVPQVVYKLKLNDISFANEIAIFFKS